MNQQTTSKKQLLDPIGSMCHIVSLIFKPINTKIGINNHAIIVQDNSRFQWLDRYWNGDNRENISLLFNIVIRIIEWYVIPLSGKYKTGEFVTESKSFDHLSDTEKKIFWDCIEKMCKYTCLAFERLQKTYYTGPEPTNVVTTIQFYINTLEDSIEGKYSRHRLPKCIILAQQHNLLDYNKIKTLWNGTKLNEICELYEKCFIKTELDKKITNRLNKYSNQPSSNMSNMSNKKDKDKHKDKDKDNKTSETEKTETIETSETQINEEEIIGTDIEKNKHWKEVSGYIKSINHFLDLYDEDFRVLINFSNEG